MRESAPLGIVESVMEELDLRADVTHLIRYLIAVVGASLLVVIAVLLLLAWAAFDVKSKFEEEMKRRKLIEDKLVKMANEIRGNRERFTEYKDEQERTTQLLIQEALTNPMP